MGANITDNAIFEAYCSDRTAMKQWAVVAIGATGAPTVNVSSYGFSVTRTGAGTYNLVFQAAPLGLAPIVILRSPAKTVVAYVVSAFSPTAGTATIKTLAGTNAAVDTDPANGDFLHIVFESFGYVAE